jgi:hypothetical protein
MKKVILVLFIFYTKCVYAQYSEWYTFVSGNVSLSGYYLYSSCSVAGITSSNSPCNGCNNPSFPYFTYTTSSSKLTSVSVNVGAGGQGSGGCNVGFSRTISLTSAGYSETGNFGNCTADLSVTATFTYIPKLSIKDITSPNSTSGNLEITVTDIDAYSSSSYNSTAPFKFQVSLDGSTWVTINNNLFTSTGITDKRAISWNNLSGSHNIDWIGQELRIRVVQTYNSVDYHSAFKLFKFLNDLAITTTQTPSCSDIATGQLTIDLGSTGTKNSSGNYPLIINLYDNQTGCNSCSTQSCLSTCLVNPMPAIPTTSVESPSPSYTIPTKIAPGDYILVVQNGIYSYPAYKKIPIATQTPTASIQYRDNYPSATPIYHAKDCDTYGYLKIANIVNAESPLTLTDKNGTNATNIGNQVFELTKSYTGSIVLTDNKGCKITNGGVSSINFNPSPAINFSTDQAGSKNISCLNGSDGEVHFSLSGGYGINVVTINSTPKTPVLISGTNYKIAGLSYGTDGKQQINVSNGVSCPASGTITISQPSSALAASVSMPGKIPPSCNTSTDGSITISASGGWGSYLYEQTGGTYQSSSTVGGLGGGTYNFTIKDGGGCETNVNNVSLTPPSAITILTSGNLPASCSSAKNGQITIDLGGGTGTKNYTVTGPGSYSKAGSFATSTSFTLNDLPVGTFTILVTDANSCPKTGNFAIASATNTISILSGISLTEAATCKQMHDGVVNIAINGGDRPAKDYFLQTPTGWRMFTAGSDTAYVRRLSAGVNSISVKDATGCVASTTYDMPLKSAHFQIEATPYDAACNKSFTGKVYVNRMTGTGTAGNITFMFNDTNKLDNDNAWYYKLQPGTYLVKAQDNNLCRDSVSFTVQPSSTALKINKTIVRDAACANNPTGIIKVQKNAGTGIGNITFYLPDSAITNTSEAYFYDLKPGTYTLKAYDNIGCRDSVDAQISISANTLQLSSYVLNDAACSNSPSGRIVASNLINKSKTGWGPIDFKIATRINTSKDTTIFDKLAPGTYTVTAADSVGCTQSKNLGIAALPNAVYFKNSVSSPQSCTEIINGKVGVGAITSSNIKKFVFKNFTLNTTSDWKDTILYNHIKGDAYTIRVIDTNRCYRDTIITISNLHNNPKPELLLPNGYDSLACASAPNGAIRLTIKQPIRKPAYTIFIKNNPEYVPTDSTFKGLKHVKDSIIVIDAVGCRGGDMFETPVLKNSIKFGSAPSVTNASCAIAGNGIITAMASNGLPYASGQYKYKISRGDSVIGQTATFKGLEAKKTYRITVLDSVNCDNVMDVPIGVIDDSLRLRSPVAKVATCSEKLTGSVLATRAYGTPRKKGFEFTITGIDNPLADTAYQSASDSTITFKGLGKGQYTVAVADSNNCSVSQHITIGSTPLFSTNGNIVTRVKRFGKPEGQIKSVINDGNGQFVYQLYQLESPMSPTPLRQDTIKNRYMAIDKLLGGNYLLKIKDTANCEYIKGGTEWMEDTIWVQQPEKALALRVAYQLNVKCFGDTTAWVKLRAEGGYPAYKFAINDTNNFVKDSVFLNLKKGTYKLYVRDNERIDTSTEVEITQPLMPLSAVTKDALSTKCFNYADGTAKLSINGGTSPYFISLDSTHWLSDSTITGLKAKTYKVLVHDSQNCLTRVYGLKIDQPDSIMVSSQSVTNTPCLKNEGSINVTQVSGGNGGYSYTWYKNNSQVGSQAQLTNLYSGRYTLSITDTYGCKGDTAFFVSDLSNLQLDTILTIPVSCWGGSDGKAELKIRSGAEPFTITWPGKTAQLSQFTTGGLPRGTHNVYVEDGQKCTSSFLFNVGTFEDITIPETWVSAPLCLGNNNGSIKVKAAGGKADYMYNWGTNGNGDEAKNLAPGSYPVTVTDANNCIKTFNYTLAYAKVEKPNLGNDLLLCKQSDYVLNPKGYVNYNWTINNKPVSTDPIMVVHEAGTYNVDVESSEGCLGSDTVNISFTADALLADFLLTTKAYAGDTIMLVEISRPLPDSVTWILASAGKLIDYGTYYKQIALPDTGTYEFSMIAYYKGCADMVKKYVQVVNPDGDGSNKKSAKADLIQSVSLYPNPNGGQFSADIQLSRRADIFMRIVNLGTGRTEFIRTSKGADFYTERFNLHLVTGLYVLYIQAENESRTVNLVVR